MFTIHKSIPHVCIFDIRPLSSVQNNFAFILHEPYDLSWPLGRRSLGENMYYCASSIYFFKRKTNPLRYQIQFCIWANWFRSLS